jgi:nucleotide-binding universal stress UspA family protein
MTEGRPFVAEWQLAEVASNGLLGTVMERGRAADLVIVGQTDPDRDLYPERDFPEHLALAIGRPVLVIPYAGRYPVIGRNVVIAWKAERAAVRAVFDALPLLQGAQNVHILEIDRREDERTLDSGVVIAASLARHAVKATVRTSVAPDISIGDAILSRLADLDADLLVMGAYGHARMRELVFGGVTRHIAGHMTVPTLFSH